jgi:hypothetical protein
MRIRIVAVGLLLMLCSTGVVSAQNGYDLLAQGLSKARVQGDIPGAIKIYETLVRNFKTNRMLVARALVQLGDWNERVRGGNARRYYDEVITDYSDQKDVADEARRRRAALPAIYIATESVRDRLVWEACEF